MCLHQIKWSLLFCRLQTLLLGPLVELSAIPQPDIRSRQLECIMAILHSSAESLTQGWPLVLSVIGTIFLFQQKNPFLRSLPYRFMNASYILPILIMHSLVLHC